MKVFLLGHKGMLGRMVEAFLRQQKVNVVTSEHRYSVSDDKLLKAVSSSGCEWVINTIGLIPQKSNDVNRFFELNSIFPFQLRQALNADQNLLHASTDCIFKGEQGNYAVTSIPDDKSAYGYSKRLGELIGEEKRVWIIRASVIGPREHSTVGLMGWFLSQEGNVKGYSNHFWNGVTTLEWAKHALQLIRSPQKFPTLIQLGFSPAISKHDLLLAIAKQWRHNVTIERHACAEKTDRSLLPTHQASPIAKQLQELYDFLPKHSR